MKTKTVLMLLAGSMIVAALPLATAEEACSRAGTTEAISHPTRGDAYIYLDLTHPDRIGEWIETNKAAGLQTLDCFKLGIMRYRADTKAELLA